MRFPREKIYLVVSRDNERCAGILESAFTSGQPEGSSPALGTLSLSLSQFLSFSSINTTLSYPIYFASFDSRCFPAGWPIHGACQWPSVRRYSLSRSSWSSRENQDRVAVSACVSFSRRRVASARDTSVRVQSVPRRSRGVLCVPQSPTTVCDRPRCVGPSSRSDPALHWWPVVRR